MKLSHRARLESVAVHPTVRQVQPPALGAWPAVVAASGVTRQDVAAVGEGFQP